MDGSQIRAAVKEFNALRRREDADCEKVTVRRVDEATAIVKLEYEDEVVEMTYPRDAQSIWFCMSPDWLSAELNSSILVGLFSFNQILANLTLRIDKRLMDSMGMSSSSGMEESMGLSQSGMGLEASGLYVENHDSNFALSADELIELQQYVSEAQQVLGEDKVCLVPELGSVKMSVDIFAMMDSIIAAKLGFVKDENVFMTFSYEKSASPSVSCTQRVSPGYGVRNHLKSILEFFFLCWRDDREQLKKVGRPPAGFVSSTPAIAAPEPSNDNNSSMVAESDPTVSVASKQSWWKSVKSVFKPVSSAIASGSGVVLTKQAVNAVMELGFDPIACVRALIETRNDVDTATMRVVNNGNKYQPTKKQSTAFETLLSSKGVSDDATAAVAFVKCNYVIDDALAAIQGDPNNLWRIQASSVLSLPSKKKGSKEKERAEDHPFNQDNFVFALLSYLQERLSHYSSYCVSCQAPHSCNNPDGGVVCSEALCVFQLEESPMEKLLSVHLCPFKDCCDLDLSTVGKEFMGMPLDQICKSYGLNSQQLLELLLHRYLPTDQVKIMLENGLKNTNCQRLESVLNPSLVARFEHAWKTLREKHAGSDVKVAPYVAYHGTSAEAVKGILETGFLIDKLSKGSGDNGWFGCGVYFSPHVQTAMGYCRGKAMLVSAVLMGKICKLTGRCDGAQLTPGYDSHEDPSGHEWVIYEEAHILPVYLIHF